jgi:hypothetical protein
MQLASKRVEAMKAFFRSPSDGMQSSTTDTALAEPNTVLAAPDVHHTQPLRKRQTTRNTQHVGVDTMRGTVAQGGDEQGDHVVAFLRFLLLAFRFLFLFLLVA